mgnify:CR=1 FL=1
MSLQPNRRELQIKLEEDRKRLVEAINTTFSNLGSAALGLLTDRDRLLTAVGGLSLLALGVYSGAQGGWLLTAGWFTLVKLLLGCVLTAGGQG